MMTNAELAKEYEQYIISKRRYFHMHPEMTGEEYQTVKAIMDELENLKVPHLEIENGGVLAWLKGPTDNGRSVLLRADIDALPVTESDDNLLPGRRTCKSEVPGLMHACGHDGHTAMLLGTVRVLQEKQENLKGTVYFIFERGEEYADNYWNILKYFDDHDIRPDTCWGIHLYAGLESGKLSIADGSVMAASIPFTVTIKGQSGHGSRPDLAVNPLDAFCAVYQAFASFRPRRVNPFVGFTSSICKVRGGELGNVIPDEVTFQGSVRTLDRDVAGKAFQEEFIDFVTKITEAYRCEPILKSMSCGYPVVNSDSCAAFARKQIAAELGEEVLKQAEPWMATDSFSIFLKLFPGVYAFLGIRNPEKGCGAEHHNAHFDIDEDVLWMGTAAAATYALNFLEFGPDTSGEKTLTGLRDLLQEKGDKKRLAEMYGITEKEA